MPGAKAANYEVAQRSDHLEVRGVSRRDMVEALQFYATFRSLQAGRVATTRAELVRRYMAQNVSVTPLATRAQAQRLATHRDALLATPWLTHESLRELRGDEKDSSTRTWVTRRRKAHAMFTVTHGGRTLIPAFQLDDHGEPRAELQPILSRLIEAGVQGWSLWTWLTTPTSYLSGGVPERVARTAPARALRAAERFAVRPVA